MRTIRETIDYLREEARRERFYAGMVNDYEDCQYDAFRIRMEHHKSAEEHEQIADWLERLDAKPYKVERMPERDFIDDREGMGGKYTRVYSFHCPNCGECMGDTYWEGNPTADWQSYCPDCGQHIDWVHDVEYPILDPEEEAELEKRDVTHLVGAIYANEEE